MSLIEQASQRLEQLRPAGIVVPEVAGATPATLPHPVPDGKRLDAERKSQRVTLDLDALGAAGIVTPEAPRSRVADQRFRRSREPHCPDLA